MTIAMTTWKKVVFDSVVVICITIGVCIVLTQMATCTKDVNKGFQETRQKAIDSGLSGIPRV